MASLRESFFKKFPELSFGEALIWRSSSDISNTGRRAFWLKSFPATNTNIYSPPAFSTEFTS